MWRRTLDTKNRLRASVVVSALLLVVNPPPSTADPSVVDPTLSVFRRTEGLTFPTAMAFLGEDDMLVLEKATGRVRRVRLGSLLQTPVVEVLVNANAERGLLGIAINTLDPPEVFLFYTEAESQGGTVLGNRVYRYTWNPVLGLLENPILVLDLPASSTGRHNGGALALGPPGELSGSVAEVGDGSVLYAVIGDSGRGRQLQNNAAGPPPGDAAVVFRVKQNGDPVADNPFTPYCEATTTQTCTDDDDCPTGESCITEVARYLAYGIRNSFGLGVDPMTGALWETENGHLEYDEVNLVEPGMNGGWRPIMGPDSRDPEGIGDLWNLPGAGSTYRDPELSWLTPVVPTAIVLPSQSDLGGAYASVALVAGFGPDQIYALPLNAARDGLELGGVPGLGDGVADDGNERDALLFGSEFANVTDLELGPDGKLYVLTHHEGAIYRIAAPSGIPALSLLQLFGFGVILLSAAVWRISAALTSNRAASASPPSSGGGG